MSTTQQLPDPLVTSSPNRMSGALVFAGTRVPVRTLFDYLDAGKTIKVVLKQDTEDGCFLPERLIQSGYKVRLFKEEEIDLEDVFMGITKGITN